MTLRLRVDGAKPARIWLLQCNSMLLSPLPLGGQDYPNDDEVVLPDLAMDEEQYVVSPLFPGSSKDDERLSPLAQALREAAAMVVEPAATAAPAMAKSTCPPPLLGMLSPPHSSVGATSAARSGSPSPSEHR